jgi:hypothetical protein
MAGETLKERARAARARRQEAYKRDRLEQDQWQNKRTLAFVNRALGAQVSAADLRQVLAEEGQGEGRVEYRFTVDGENFALTGTGSLSVLRSCVMCDRLAPAGSISLTVDAALAETGGDDFDSDRVLATIADLLEARPYCWYHRQPEPPEYTELEARVRQLAREEVDAAGYADENHSHPEYADLYQDH